MHISWARNNRSGLIRVPIAKRGNPTATRIEYRSPDPACNPYLAFSVMLAAGMRGVAEGYELPVEADANLFEIGDEVLAKLGIEQLPQSLSDALRAMERDRARPRRPRRAHLRVVPAQQAHGVAGLQDPRLDVRDRPLPPSRSDRDGQRTPRRLRGSRLARAGPHARPRRLPVEGGRVGRRRRRVRAAGRAGRARSSTAPPTPPAPGVRPHDPQARARQPAGAGPRVGHAARRAELRDDLFDDFCLAPFHPAELEARAPPPAVARSAAGPGRT